VFGENEREPAIRTPIERIDPSLRVHTAGAAGSHPHFFDRAAERLRLAGDTSIEHRSFASRPHNWSGRGPSAFFKKPQHRADLAE
jgi:hypothetical protein